MFFICVWPFLFIYSAHVLKWIVVFFLGLEMDCGEWLGSKLWSVVRWSSSDRTPQAQLRRSQLSPRNWANWACMGLFKINTPAQKSQTVGWRNKISTVRHSIVFTISVRQSWKVCSSRMWYSGQQVIVWNATPSLYVQVNCLWSKAASVNKKQD